MVTSLKQPTRIARNISNQAKPPAHEVAVVSTRWVIDDGCQPDLLSRNQITVLSQTAKVVCMVDSPKVDADSRPASYGEETNYICLQRHSLRHYNDELVELLRVLEDERHILGSEVSALSYAKACSAIIAFPRKVESVDQISRIPNIGPKMAAKIKEYLDNGTIVEVERIRESERYKCLKLFSSVFGVGPAKAQDWYARGYRLLEDIPSDKLCQVQVLGLQYYKDFSRPLSRVDVEEIANLVFECAKQVDEGAETMIVGGYRRGKESSGDCDVLLVPSLEGVETEFLHTLLRILQEKGHMTHVLQSEYNKYSGGAGREREELKSSGKFDQLNKAICAIAQPSTNVFRQVDIIVAPRSVKGCAIVGWTGSKMYERSLRLFLSKERSLHFTSHGLYSKVDMHSIPVESELDFFKACKMPYLPPEFRNA